MSTIYIYISHISINNTIIQYSFKIVYIHTSNQKKNNIYYFKIF